MQRVDDPSPKMILALGPCSSYVNGPHVLLIVLVSSGTN